MIFTTINKFLYQSNINKKTNRNTREINVFYPSQATCIDIVTNKPVGECLRALYYDITNTPVTNFITPSNIRKINYGNVAEKVEIDILKEMSILVKEQESFEIILEKIKIKGRVDAIIELNKRLHILEYKNSGGYTFKQEVFGTVKNNGFPRIKNLMQAMIYVDYFSKQPNPIDNCYLMYIERDSLATKEFEVKLNEFGQPIVNGEIYENVNIKGIYDRLNILYEHLKNNILPKCDFRPYYSLDEATKEYRNKEIKKFQYDFAVKEGYCRDNQCGYCLYYNKCLSDENKITREIF